MVFFLLVITTITGCAYRGLPIADESATEESATTSGQELSKDEPDGIENEFEMVHPIVFDFAELSEEDFPRGTWTINQLVKKYGALESATAKYWAVLGYQEVIVEAVFKDIFIQFWPVDVSGFSFRDKVEEPVRDPVSEDFKLNEGDKNIELEIQQSIFYDTNLEFSHGIRIGQSTKAEILSAYPEGTTYPYYGPSGEGDGKITNTIWVYYGSRDESGNLPKFQEPIGTSISYNLDEAGVLQSVEIVWLLLVF